MNKRHLPGSARLAVTGCATGLLMFVLTGCGGMSGTYEEVGGKDTIEFRSGSTVYMSFFGTTVAGEYEVDGDRVVLTFPDGSLVLTIKGDTLEGGPLGETYQKK